jgi:hypothetical protein
MGAAGDLFETMEEEVFDSRYGDTPLERSGLEGMRRNFRAAFGSALSEPKPR